MQDLRLVLWAVHSLWQLHREVEAEGRNEGCDDEIEHRGDERSIWWLLGYGLFAGSVKLLL